MAIEGFISEPPPEGTQLVELSTFKDPQLVVVEIISSDEEAETKIEDNTSEENTENPVGDKDFEVFYRTNKSEEEWLSLHPIATLVSEDQEAIEVLEGMVIEKRLLDLLSLLESHARTTAPKAPIVPKPLTPIPPTPAQIELVDKKWKRDKKGGKGPIKEGEVQEEALPEPTKVAKITRAQLRKGGESSNAVSKQRSRVPN